MTEITQPRTKRVVLIKMPQPDDFTAKQSLINREQVTLPIRLVDNNTRQIGQQIDLPPPCKDSPINKTSDQDNENTTKGSKDTSECCNISTDTENVLQNDRETDFSEGTDNSYNIEIMMKNCKLEYSDIRKYSIFCGTYNVNRQSPSESLVDWLCVDQRQPDIYIIGFQESHESNTFVFIDSSCNPDKWQSQCISALSAGTKTYRTVKCHRLKGIMILVIAEENIFKDITEVTSATKATRIVRLGNKGAAGISIKLNDTTICMLSCQLFPNISEVERRNEDFFDIERGMLFNDTSTTVATISDHDIIFWLGDLNYRINDLDNQKIKSLIRVKNYAELLKYDQLLINKREGKCFENYFEENITFKPTYKYNPNTDLFDTSKKQHSPGWCDRILYRGSGVTPIAYRSHQTLMISDHKPVSATFEIETFKVDNNLRRIIFKRALQEIDRQKMEIIPKLEINTTELIFKDVRYNCSQFKEVIVTNTGKTEASYYFKKSENSQVCKTWLTIEPEKYNLQIGESITVKFLIDVNSRNAASINKGIDTLCDVIRFSIKGGRYSFISINGNYLPSCYGQSLSDLIMNQRPIRCCKEFISVDVPDTYDKTMKVPREICRLIEHLKIYGLDEVNLILKEGSVDDVKLIQESLDTGLPNHLPGSVFSVCEAFYKLLESLLSPVIPEERHTDCIRAKNDPEASRMIIESLPDCNKDTFKYIMNFFQCVLDHSHNNKLTTDDIAEKCTQLLMPSISHTKDTDMKDNLPNEIINKQTFIIQFLVNDFYRSV